MVPCNNYHTYTYMVPCNIYRIYTLYATYIHRIYIYIYIYIYTLYIWFWLTLHTTHLHTLQTRYKHVIHARTALKHTCARNCMNAQAQLLSPVSSAQPPSQQLSGSILDSTQPSSTTHHQLATSSRAQSYQVRKRETHTHTRAHVRTHTHTHTTNTRKYTHVHTRALVHTH